MGKITPPENIDDVKEVIENKYLRRIAGKKSCVESYSDRSGEHSLWLG